MFEKKLEELSKEELIQRIRLTAEMAVATDGMWFVAAEEAVGYDKALEMDTKVWVRYPTVFIKRIRKYIELPANPLEKIKAIIKYDPLWLPINSDFPEDTPQRLIFRVINCPALEAMERMGRELLTCEPVEKAYMTALAQAVDPRIQLTAMKLPPRKSPDEICCQWLFSLTEET
jgi:hypothetical protein